MEEHFQLSSRKNDDMSFYLWKFQKLLWKATPWRMKYVSCKEGYTFKIRCVLSWPMSVIVTVIFFCNPDAAIFDDTRFSNTFLSFLRIGTRTICDDKSFTPLKFNIDTPNSHIWKEIHLLNHHFWYLAWIPGGIWSNLNDQLYYPFDYILAKSYPWCKIMSLSSLRKLYITSPIWKPKTSEMRRILPPKCPPWTTSI